MNRPNTNQQYGLTNRGVVFQSGYTMRIYHQEVVVPEEIPLNHDAFRFLAAQAGLDPDGPHLNELYPYVRSVLSGVRSLDEIDLDGSEPDLVFIPEPEAS